MPVISRPTHLPKLIAHFQPCTTDGAVGLETITHSGESIALDLTAYVVGLDISALHTLRAEAGRFSGKDLDHIAELVPDLVERHAGDGGYDILLDAEDIDAFFAEHGCNPGEVTGFDLMDLRKVYGTETGAPPVVDGTPVAETPSAPAFR